MRLVVGFCDKHIFPLGTGLRSKSFCVGNFVGIKTQQLFWSGFKPINKEMHGAIANLLSLQFPSETLFITVPHHNLLWVFYFHDIIAKKQS